MASAWRVLGDNNNGVMRHLHTYAVMRMITKNVAADAESRDGSLQNESLQISGWKTRERTRWNSEPPSPPSTSAIREPGEAMGPMRCHSALAG